MSRFERRILARCFRATGAVLLLLLWLAFLITAHRHLGRIGGWYDLLLSRSSLAHLLLSLESSLFVAPSLGVATVLRELSKSGILTSFIAAEGSLGRLRRTVWLLASLTVVASCLVLEASSWMSRSAQTHVGRIQKIGALDVWRRHGASNQVLIFRSDTLDVSRFLCKRAPGGDRLTDPETLAGSPIRVDGMIPEPDTDSLLSPPPVSRWAQSHLQQVLVSLNRVSLGGVLLLFSSYMCLLLPLSRQWMVFVSIPLLIAATSLVAMGCSVLLWAGGTLGHLAEVIWVLGVSGVAFLADRTLQRRGMRYC
ncbi:MAG: hypothetical protein ACE5F1_18385 [Planctomycetota bacterium]